MLSSPPTNHTQAIDDKAFNICIALRYHIDYLKDSGIHCIDCTKEYSLWHVLRCRYTNNKYNIYIHDKTKMIIGETIKKHKNVLKIEYEKKARQETNSDTHIPDIVVTFTNGKQHVLDVTIQNKFRHEKSGNYEPGSTTGFKIDQYKGTNTEVHIIVFDNSGRINSSSWNYLKELGMRRGVLKYIQAQIMKCNSWALQNTSNQCMKQNMGELQSEVNGIQIASERIQDVK